MESIAACYFCVLAAVHGAGGAHMCQQRLSKTMQVPAGAQSGMAPEMSPPETPSCLSDAPAGHSFRDETVQLWLIPDAWCYYSVARGCLARDGTIMFTCRLAALGRLVLARVPAGEVRAGHQHRRTVLLHGAAVYTRAPSDRRGR